MLISAELRWFWNAEPVEVRRWFNDLRTADAQVTPGGGEPRTDRYLPSGTSSDIGIKVRGGGPGVEIKGLVSEREVGATAPFAGRMQCWVKWTGVDLRIDNSIDVHKLRRLRKIDLSQKSSREIALGANEKPVDPQERLPEAGCNVEYTELTIGDSAKWWTLGFEAFGPIDRAYEHLAMSIRFVTSRSRPPSISAGFELSYPAWLMRASTSTTL